MNADAWVSLTGTGRLMARPPRRCAAAGAGRARFVANTHDLDRAPGAKVGPKLGEVEVADPVGERQLDLGAMPSSEVHSLRASPSAQCCRLAMPSREKSFERSPSTIIRARVSSSPTSNKP
ncbi:MAG: hypothetical protein U1E17_12755 [Geminicoccaceae bacterium]